MTRKLCGRNSKELEELGDKYHEERMRCVISRLRVFRMGVIVNACAYAVMPRSYPLGVWIMYRLNNVSFLLLILFIEILVRYRRMWPLYDFIGCLAGSLFLTTESITSYRLYKLLGLQTQSLTYEEEAYSVLFCVLALCVCSAWSRVHWISMLATSLWGVFVWTAGCFILGSPAPVSTLLKYWIAYFSCAVICAFLSLHMERDSRQALRTVLELERRDHQQQVWLDGFQRILSLNFDLVVSSMKVDARLGLVSFENDAGLNSFFGRDMTNIPLRECVSSKEEQQRLDAFVSLLNNHILTTPKDWAHPPKVQVTFDVDMCGIQATAPGQKLEIQAVWLPGVIHVHSQQASSGDNAEGVLWLGLAYVRNEENRTKDPYAMSEMSGTSAFDSVGSSELDQREAFQSVHTVLSHTDFSFTVVKADSVGHNLFGDRFLGSDFLKWVDEPDAVEQWLKDTNIHSMIESMTWYGTITMRHPDITEKEWTARMGVEELVSGPAGSSIALTLQVVVPAETKITAPTAFNCDVIDIQSSRPETTVTGFMFQAMKDDAQSSATQHLLEKLVDMGSQQHWLVKSSDICIFPQQILGVGSFGCVVAAEFHGTKVAFKFPRCIATDSTKYLANLANELRILRHLRHPNICLFYGACIEPQTLEIGLLLELVHGFPMCQCIKSCATVLDIPVRLQVLLHVCAALRYLHELHPRIIHGDLKSSNVLVAHFEQGAAGCCAKLVDFGLSFLVTKNAKCMGGTLSWVAPEVLLKIKGAFAPASDAFSFGRLVFFTMTGQVPLKGITRKQLRTAAHLGTELPLDWPSLNQSPDFHEYRELSDRCQALDVAARPEMRAIYEQLSQWQPANRKRQVGVRESRCNRKSDWKSGLRQVRSVAGGNTALKGNQPQRQSILSPSKPAAVMSL